MAGQVALDPTSLRYDSPRSRDIRSATLDIAKVLGQASLNMMRERNAQTQDANRPLRIPQAGKIVDPPLDLYRKQKKFKKKRRAKRPVLPDHNSRVKSLHPPFVPDKKKHPRVQALELRREAELEEAGEEAENRRSRAAVAAGVYANAIITVAPEIPEWHPSRFPYDPSSGIIADGPNRAHADQNDEERRIRIHRSIINQVKRAELSDFIIASNNRREANEQDRIEDEYWRNHPSVIDARRRQAHRVGHLSRASINARARSRA